MFRSLHQYTHYMIIIHITQLALRGHIYWSVLANGSISELMIRTQNAQSLFYCIITMDGDDINITKTYPRTMMYPPLHWWMWCDIVYDMSTSKSFSDQYTTCTWFSIMTIEGQPHSPNIRQTCTCILNMDWPLVCQVLKWMPHTHNGRMIILSSYNNYRCTYI